MAAAYLTPAEARALGVGGAPGDETTNEAARPRRTRRQLPRDGHASTCHTCGATFTSDAAETRHVAATFHARYESEFTQ